MKCLHKWILLYHVVIVILLLRFITICATTSLKKASKSSGNITVYALEKANSFKNGSKSLKLNISWVPLDVGKPTAYSILVTSEIKETEMNRLECSESYGFYILQNVTQFNLLVPEDKSPNSMSRLQIRPNCTYKIQVYANTRSTPEEISEVNYTVPKCVGRICSCIGVKYILPVPMVEAIQVKTGQFLIKWNVTSNSNVYSHMISIGVPLLTSKAGHPVYNITQLRNVTSTTNNFTWNSKVHDQYIKVKTGYKIFVVAIDEQGCLGTQGNVTIIITDETETSYGSILWILIGIIACIIILGFLSQYFNPIRKKCDQYQLVSLFGVSQRRRATSELPSRIPQWINNPWYYEETCFELNRNDELEVPYKCINIQSELGKGQFGKVYLGNLNNNVGGLVAVKMSQCIDPSNEPEARRQLLEEIETMKTAGSHPHLVGLKGCCTSPDNPICIILEYMQGGDLLTYLHSRRNIESDVTPLCNFERATSRYVNIVEKSKEDSYNTIDKKQFIKFALDIARGMEYLETKGITHRDLAARNVLLTSDLTLKVSDFGLSRNGIYVINNVAGKVRQLPIRWMSPEAVRDHIFSSKSDVWSFGIVLWEIGTLGSFPYSNIQDEDLLRCLIQDKCRLACPDTISQDIYEIMCCCWNTAPQNRPSFAQLILDLQTLNESLYSTHETNPCYILLSQ